MDGGDICEDRFNTVRDDISSWISKGGSKGLNFPAEISLDQYNSKMLSEISKAQVSCTDQKIMVDGAEKTCENFVDLGGTSRIICNSGQFMSTSESDQYVLAHHEYAGLSGFEVNQGEKSTYEISNQISGYLA